MTKLAAAPTSTQDAIEIPRGGQDWVRQEDRVRKKDAKFDSDGSEFARGFRFWPGAKAPNRARYFRSLGLTGRARPSPSWNQRAANLNHSKTLVSKWVNH
jgi:hypothetical protein